MLAILTAVILAAAPRHDTVFTTDGGWVLGTVVEESSQWVAIQAPDGTIRRLPSAEVVRIEYADGSVSIHPAEHVGPQPAFPPAGSGPPAGVPPPPPPPGYSPPPYHAPPRPQPPNVQQGALPPSEFWVSASLGGMMFDGNVARGVGFGRIFGSAAELGLEGGWSLTPHLGLGVYLDVAVGDPGSQLKAFCNADPASPGGGLGGASCSTLTVNAGILARHTFLPYARVRPWLAIGTGVAYANAHYTYGDPSDPDAPSSDIVTYTGWEIARLMAGVDVRSTQVGIAVGLYAGVSLTRYTSVESVAGTWPLDAASVHTMVEGGFRVTLL